MIDWEINLVGTETLRDTERENAKKKNFSSVVSSVQSKNVKKSQKHEEMNVAKVHPFLYLFNRHAKQMLIMIIPKQLNG